MSSVIGVDLGGTKVVVACLRGNRMGDSLLHPTDRSGSGALIDQLVAMVNRIRSDDLAAVGIGVPSVVEFETGRVVSSVNIPLRDVPLRQVLGERLGVPVFVDNDANLAALAEHRAGAARGHSEAVVLTIGTGIGSGLILRNELYRGAIGAGAELGHTVIDLNGPPCQGNCPNHGCIESLASGTALAREALRIAHEQPSSGLGRALAAGRELEGPLVTELAHDGDTAAIEAIELIGTRLGVAIASFVNIFNPEVVIIGGGVMGAGELLLNAAQAEMLRRALPPSRDIVEIVPAAFGVEAGMIGAAALAFDGLAQRAH